jgi:hypothetical protein
MKIHSWITMKIRVVACFFAGHLLLAAAAGHGAMRGAATLQAEQPAPAPAPGPDSTPNMTVVTVTAKMPNVNYFDLTEDMEDFSENLGAGAPIGTGELPSKTEKAAEKVATEGETVTEVAEETKEVAEKTEEAAGDTTPVEAVGDAIQDLGLLRKRQTVTKHRNPEDKSWSQLAPANMKYWQVLGWTQASWDSGNPADSPPSDHKAWGQLTQQEQSAATQLGYNAEHWNNDHDHTVQKSLRRSMEAAVKQTICPNGDAPSPAKVVAALKEAPAPALGVLPVAASNANLPPPVNAVNMMAGQQSKSSAPAPAVATAGCPHVHVAFEPGNKMKKKHQDNMINRPAHGSLKATDVTITVYERNGNGLPDMTQAKENLETALGSGVLHTALANAAAGILGFTPKIHGLDVKYSQVEAFDMVKCDNHMKNMVTEFTGAYSSRQVPVALYNECSNFITKLSFSHDLVLDPRDTADCKRSSVTFARRWGKGEPDAAKEFDGMCHKFCEARYGNDAPQCHVPGADGSA